MAEQPTIHCTRCGRPGRGAYCGSCGNSRTMTPAEHAGHVAFMLNELELPPLAAALPPDQLQQTRSHYRTELWRLLGPIAPGRPWPMAAAGAPAAAAAQAPVRRRAPSAMQPPVPPRAAREPFDWGWLAEQQANLLLFAGAFLTVVAALIYVGYSGQAVGGALKMSLLAGYTLAFLLAGWFCLRIPRVEIAGRVFFAIGALLVPINFVAAREIFTESDLSAQSMWLAGSIVTAAFYATVAWIGLGRLYAIGAGLALVSGTAAAVVVADVPVEWAALPFIGVALLLVLSGIAGDERVRERLGKFWSPIGQATALAAVAFAVFIALVANEPDDDINPANGWFLPVTLAAFAVAAAVPALLTRERIVGLAAAIGAAAAGIAVAYGLDWPAEGYVVTSAASGAALGAALPAIRAQAKRLPADAEDAVAGLGAATFVVAGLVAYVTLQSYGDGTYELATRWFLAPAFALAFFYTCFVASGARLRVKLGAWISAALVGAAFGTALSVVFGLAWPPEAYAIGVAAMALAAVVVAWLAGRNSPLGEKAWLPRRLDDMATIGGALGAVAGGVIAVLAMQAMRDHALTPWVGAVTFTLAAAASIVHTLDRRERWGVPAFALSLYGLTASAVYGLGLSEEYYAFAMVAPALAWIALARFGQARLDGLGGAGWRQDAVVLARIAAVAGAAIAIGAALAGEEPETDFTPQTRIFLPIALGMVALAAALDASRARRWDVSAGFAVATAATALAVPYVFEAHGAWYGAALSAAGLGLALSGRFVRIAWFDDDARDGVALVAIAFSTLPFWSLYDERPAIGAAVHLAAAAFFAGAALLRASKQTLAELFGQPALEGMPVSGAWLYPAGFFATVGYVFALQSAGGEGDGGTLAPVLMTMMLAFLAAGVVLRFARPELRAHAYVLSVLTAIASLTMAEDAVMLSTLLTVYVVAFAALGVFERSPLAAAPAFALGFLAVPAWQARLEAPLSVVPVTYSAIGLLGYGAALALGDNAASRALRAGAAAYAIVAPAAGFTMLAWQGDDEFQTGSALYQWSTVAVVVVGLIGLVESLVSGRRWMIVPASAVLTVALLLQIGRLEPENPQAYTAVIGAYLVLLGVVGLGRARLVPELVPEAVYIEALGAVTIMLPSFIQSFDGGWRYQWILLVEATLFLAAAVALRRRGLLAAALAFIVLAAARALFDAVNALPNWIVVALAGVALLAAGLGILLARDRWDAWQRAIAGWWRESDPEPVLHG